MDSDLLKTPSKKKEHFDVKNLIHLINTAEHFKLVGIAKKRFVLDNLKYLNLSDGCDKVPNWDVIKPLMSDVIDVIINSSNILNVNNYANNCCEII